MNKGIRKCAKYSWALTFPVSPFVLMTEYVLVSAALKLSRVKLLMTFSE